MLNLAYLRILQRAWNRYPSEDDTSCPRVTVRVRGERVSEDVKVKHLGDFMAMNKATGTTVKEYGKKVGLKDGNLQTYTKWLMTGRLPSVGKGALLEFFTARWAANKVVKREISHAE